MPAIGLFMENPCHTYAAQQSVTKFMPLIYENLVTVIAAAKPKFIHTYAAQQSVTKFMSLIYETLVTVTTEVKLKLFTKSQPMPAIGLFIENTCHTYAANKV